MVGLFASEGKCETRVPTLIVVCSSGDVGICERQEKKHAADVCLACSDPSSHHRPTAGFTVEDPRGESRWPNRMSRRHMLSWGRYNPILQTNDADLIVVVRKGNGRMVNDTIHDPRQNNRPGSIIPADNGVSISGQHGTSSPPQPSPEPTPQMDIGQTEDSFLVYEGGGDRPLDRAPAWRYIAKDGLHDAIRYRPSMRFERQSRTLIRRPRKLPNPPGFGANNCSCRIRRRHTAGSPSAFPGWVYWPGQANSGPKPCSHCTGFSWRSSYVFCHPFGQ
jgi:hypothetical protein